MRVGIALPHYDFSFPGGGAVSYERLRDAAVRAEALGFDSGWVSDHFFLSLARYGGGDEPQGSLEPMTSLVALATATSKIRLGTLVLGPFRHPGQLAKMASVVDLVSGGRFDLGIGAGWYEDEFRAFGYGFGSVGERFGLLEETLAVLRLLFGEGPATFEGRHLRLDGAWNRPEPAQQPGPPVWLGAKGGPRALRMAARHADGWNTVWRWSVDDYAARVADARRICEEEGRDPATLRRSVGLYTLIGEDRADLERRYEALGGWMPGALSEPLERFAEGALVGTIEEAADTAGRFAELGVEELIVSPAGVPFAVPDWDEVELIARELVPRVRAA
ncbi:MAG TPA: LLM class flavin-dependent oxidoreductase [Actinomycetota bacterium]|nr:LLM class flavin-dependent oxidoreductase [Actinomycetota bacterium]